jgi:hypothetical protein
MSSSTASSAGRFAWMSEIKAYLMLPSGRAGCHPSETAYTFTMDAELKKG